MTISVITVCRNAEDYLADCMRSVLTQSYADVEYVVIDGGSTDGTLDIIDQHASRLAYWHSKPDRGLAHAFNLGVQHTRGEWLLFLNSDDYLIDGDALQRMAGHLDRHRAADVVFGQVQLVTREQAPRPVRLLGRSWQWAEFRRHDFIPHPAAFTQRAYFDRVGAFSEDFRIAFDYEHYLRAGKDLGAVFVPELVSAMRMDGVSRALAPVTQREVKLAQQRQGAWPSPWLADAIYAYYRCRSSAGRLASRVRRVARWPVPPRRQLLQVEPVAPRLAPTELAEAAAGDGRT